MIKLFFRYFGINIGRAAGVSLLFAWTLTSCDSNSRPGLVVTSPTPDITMLDQAYEHYQEPRIQHRRFKHADLEQILLEHQSRAVLNLSEIGRSVEDRSIYGLTYGQGAKKVMMWSQMHGNEPTATMALLDIFNFLSDHVPVSEAELTPELAEQFQKVRELLREKLTLHFIPMLNPDGSNRFIRRNALDIDLNRDARAAVTPEGRLLKAYAHEVKPDFGFNLHDQNIYYNVPGTPVPVTIALLAPAYNYEREINDVRGRAIKVAAGMNKLLQSVIPGAVARYDDAYSPRSFGDNFQSWGTSTVLIESGGYKGDPEKLYIRKLNFMIILNALIEIADGSYEGHLVSDYDEIPVNDGKLFDLLLRRVRVPYNDSLSYLVDLGINRNEIHLDTTYSIQSRISDLGDLGENFGYDELAAGGSDSRSARSAAGEGSGPAGEGAGAENGSGGEELVFVPGKIHPRVFAHVGQIDHETALEFLREGYCAVQVSRIDAAAGAGAGAGASAGRGAGRVAGSGALHDLPLVIFNQRKPRLDAQPAVGREANFFLARSDGELLYAVVNGYLIDLSTGVTATGESSSSPVKSETAVAKVRIQ